MPPINPPGSLLEALFGVTPEALLDFAAVAGPTLAGFLILVGGWWAAWKWFQGD